MFIIATEIYGYIRVSTKEQNEERQWIALREIEIPEKHIFLDKQSGKDFNRPQYQKMIRRLKKKMYCILKALTVWDAIMLRFRSSGGFSQKKKELMLWCWTCRYSIQGVEKI